MHSPHKAHIADGRKNNRSALNLGPRKGLKVPLGVYASGTLLPEFDFVIKPLPKATEIKSRLLRIDGEWGHRLSYYFQNFSDRQFMVAVRNR